MDKPVIILGGSIWGSLLALRLKQTLPHIPFKLYEEESSLGNQQSHSFRRSDCGDAYHWLRPLISHSWDQHQIKFPHFEKWIIDSYHLIKHEHFHTTISQIAGSNVIKTNNKISMELALLEGSFVIDARNICHYPMKGFKKYIALEVELEDEHHLIAPVIFDGRMERRECFRNLQYLPLSKNSILIKDFWYSKNSELDLLSMRMSLNETLLNFGWKIKRVLREHSGHFTLPFSMPVIRQEGRVINLAGLFHDLTGCSIPAASKLIDEMTRTSFRFGELKEVVNKFRKENEKNQNFFRYLNQSLILEDNHQIFEAIYQQPYSAIKRLSEGKLNFVDRSRILASKKAFSFLRSFFLGYKTFRHVRH